jgi:hypothetical protein
MWRCCRRGDWAAHGSACFRTSRLVKLQLSCSRVGLDASSGWPHRF